MRGILRKLGRDWSRTPQEIGTRQPWPIWRDCETRHQVALSPLSIRLRSGLRIVISSVTSFMGQVAIWGPIRRKKYKHYRLVINWELHFFQLRCVTCFHGSNDVTCWWLSLICIFICNVYFYSTLIPPHTCTLFTIFLLPDVYFVFDELLLFYFALPRFIFWQQFWGVSHCWFIVLVSFLLVHFVFYQSLLFVNKVIFLTDLLLVICDKAVFNDALR